MTRREFLLNSGVAAVSACLPGIAAAATAAPANQAAAAQAAGAPVEIEPVTVAQEIARALREVGVGVAVNVPATGASEIFDLFSALNASPSAAANGPSGVYSFHEEAAYTVAHGASLVGRRAVAIFKAQGLAKAANSVIASLSAGVTAGLVLLVVDDWRGRHSESIIDLQDLLKGMNIPFRAPSQDALYSEIFASYAQSEALQLPVAVCVQSDMLSTTISPAAALRLPPPPEYHRDALQRVLCPLLAPFQREVLQQKLAGLDWRSIERPFPPVVPDSLPAKWRPAAEEYAPLFEAFKSLRQEHDFVSGDVGVSTYFAFEPYQCVDASTCYGGAPALAVGAALAGRNHVWAVCGDYAFIGAGQLGLIEAVARKTPLKVLLIHNGMALTSGGQVIPPAVYEQVMSAYAPQITRIANPKDRTEAQAVLSAAKAAEGLRIVVAEYLK
jgi:TPP-dependent indolepyruvate ferredoxin oxidoreductase alpha subunit